MKAQRHIPTIGLLLFFGLLCMGRPAAAKNDCERSRRLIEQGAIETNQRRRLDLFRQAVELCPQADGPHFYLGLALEEREDDKQNGNYREAEASYRRALEINPEHYGALFKLAGLEYISGQFDSARVHYDNYLKLDAPRPDNDSIRLAAANLGAKCAWLASLPAGSINARSLTRDPDRFAGIPSLVGDIAFEVGRSAMNVTGNLDYGLAGAGVMLGMRLLESRKDMGYKKIFRAVERGRFDDAYRLALHKLPDAVNDHGINSDLVFHLLRIISSSATIVRAPLAEQAPFQLGFLQMAPRFFQPENENLWVGVQYTRHLEMATAYRQLGLYYLEQQAFSHALEQFHLGSGHLDLQEEALAQHQEIGLDDRQWQKQRHLFRLCEATARAGLPDTHSEALQSMLDHYQEWSADPAFHEEADLHSELMHALAIWGHLDRTATAPHRKDVRDLGKLARFTELYAKAQNNDSLACFLRRNLFQSLVDWGEHGPAFQQLEMINRHPYLASDSPWDHQFCLWAARLHGRTSLIEQADPYLDRLPAGMAMDVYYERLQNARRLLSQNQPAAAFSLLLACKQMEEQDTVLHERTLGVAGLLWQVCTAAAGERLPLEELRPQWEAAAVNDWPAFRRAAAEMLCAMDAWKEDQPQERQVFDQLLSIAMQHPQATFEDQQTLRYLYYRATAQFEKAVAAGRELSLLREAVDTLPVYARLLDPYAALSAIYRHESRDYEKAVEERRPLLDRLLPYCDILPENTADAQVRLAESMAANGDREAALRLIREANRTFGLFWPTPVTPRHQRAYASTEQIIAGQVDVGVMGTAALGFCR